MDKRKSQMNEVINKHRIFFGIIGISIVICSCYFYFASFEYIRFKDEKKFEKSTLEIDKSVFSKRALWMFIAGCMGCNIDPKIADIEIIIQFSKEMKINETEIFEFEYRILPDFKILGKTVVIPKPIDEFPLNSTETIELVSAGFDISPSKTISLTKGAKLPLSIFWTVKPKSEGTFFNI